MNPIFPVTTLYNKYLTTWKEEKIAKDKTKTDYTKTIYTQFLKNINLSTIDKNIVKFLDRINTKDIYELELAVHYYSVIIKDQLKDKLTNIKTDLTQLNQTLANANSNNQQQQRTKFNNDFGKKKNLTLGYIGSIISKLNLRRIE